MNQYWTGSSFAWTVPCHLFYTIRNSTWFCQANLIYLTIKTKTWNKPCPVKYTILVVSAKQKVGLISHFYLGKLTSCCFASVQPNMYMYHTCVHVQNWLDRTSAESNKPPILSTRRRLGAGKAGGGKYGAACVQATVNMLRSVAPSPAHSLPPSADVPGSALMAQFKYQVCFNYMLHCSRP